MKDNMNREQMIDRLVDNDIDTILNCGATADYLVNILRRGMGYELQKDTDIIMQYNSRTWENQ